MRVAPAEVGVDFRRRLDDKLAEARLTERYLVYVCHVAEGQVKVYRAWVEFPTEDLPHVQRMIEADIAKLSVQP